MEGPYVAGRAVELAAGLGPHGNFDADHLKAIHRHLFQDVYEWAGHTRDELVPLSDGTIATEPRLRKLDGKEFMNGRDIAARLDEIATHLQETDFLRGLPREEFATAAADVMAAINEAHPFREGNGRTQRAFMQELAKQAGHTLDLNALSRERMIQASIAANENNDPSMMRRLFDEISNPRRVHALREATDYLQGHNFNWNDCYVATIEPGHRVELTMVGLAGDHFMARTESDILIGKTRDLPKPTPHRGERFTVAASQNAWSDSRDDVRRRQQEESDRHQAPVVEPAERAERKRAEHLNPSAAGETKASKQRESFTPPGQDRPPDGRGQTHDQGRGGRGGRSR